MAEQQDLIEEVAEDETPAPTEDREPSEPESDGTPPPDAEKAGETDEDEAKPPKRQQRSGLRQYAKELERRTRAQDEQIAKLTGMVEKLTSRGDEKPSEGGEPRRDAFDDYEEYLEARADWRAEQKFKEMQAQSQETDRQQAAQRERASVQASWSAQVEAAMDRYEDFEEVAFTATISDSGADIIAQMDSGADVAYYLGKHPKEAATIAELSPARQAVALGKIEAKLSIEPPKPTSAAPAPVKPVKGSGTVDSGPSDRDSTEAWMKKRRAELAKLRAGGSRR